MQGTVVFPASIQRYLGLDEAAAAREAPQAPHPAQQALTVLQQLQRCVSDACIPPDLQRRAQQLFLESDIFQTDQWLAEVFRAARSGGQGRIRPVPGPTELLGKLYALPHATLVQTSRLLLRERRGLLQEYMQAAVSACGAAHHVPRILPRSVPAVLFRHDSAWAAAAAAAENARGSGSGGAAPAFSSFVTRDWPALLHWTLTQPYITVAVGGRQRTLLQQLWYVLAQRERDLEFQHACSMAFNIVWMPADAYAKAAAGAGAPWCFLHGILAQRPHEALLQWASIALQQHARDRCSDPLGLPPAWCGDLRPLLLLRRRAKRTLRLLRALERGPRVLMPLLRKRVYRQLLSQHSWTQHLLPLAQDYRRYCEIEAVAARYRVLQQGDAADAAPALWHALRPADIENAFLTRCVAVHPSQTRGWHRVRFSEWRHRRDTAQVSGTQGPWPVVLALAPLPAPRGPAVYGSC